MDRKPLPPKPVAQAERDFMAAHEQLLKCAYHAGQGSPDAIAKAKRARVHYNAALHELRRSERAVGREGSINWIGSKLAVTRHSAAPYGPGGDDVQRLRRELQSVHEGLEELKRAVW